MYLVRQAYWKAITCGTFNFMWLFWPDGEEEVANLDNSYLDADFLKLVNLYLVKTSFVGQCYSII